MESNNLNIFENFDFSLLDEPDFKEDSVREEIINPIVKALRYKLSGNNRVIRSKKLTHPFVMTGSNKRHINNFPDYLFQVNGVYVWVLDAKDPRENITQGENREQVYFYAIHPEINVNYYALCNGKEFALFQITQQIPILYFKIKEISNYWNDLKNILFPESFTNKKTDISIENKQQASFDYQSIKPPEVIKAIEKQGAKRHFGVHGYFTKQAWKVVQKYIETFTQKGDIVLDPYGGSGVTIIEALMLGRKGIHIDINPLSVFMVSSLITPIDINEFYDEVNRIEKEFKSNEPVTEEAIDKALLLYPYPKNMALMKDADVNSIEELFTKKQLAQLAYLKYLIIQVNDTAIRNNLLLAFSSTITKINRTYHPSSSRGDNAGDCAAFRYYRFRIAPEPIDLDVIDCFKTKISKVINAKKEIYPFINERSFKNASIYKATATDLKKIANESIDYIYTDPPYGSKIPYLDLSMMWNAWLNLEVTETDYQLEAIEGGELNKTKEEYSYLISQSIVEMYRVLKFDRWMSFVFAHKDPAYWHMIVETAEKTGFEYAGAISQNNGQSTFKKKQNPFTVLKGQLIINFKKVKNPLTLAKYSLGTDITNIILQTVEGIIAKEHGSTIDQINNELILKGLELGFLDILSSKYQDLTPLLLQFFDYDKDSEKYHIKKNTKFKTNIALHLRVRYYTYSYLKRMSFQKTDPTFDEVVLYIMPLLKNGVTPEDQTILSVLEEIADKVGTNCWRLKTSGQANLFDNLLS
ncbi:MAG: DNA methyltransferase [Blastocatellia bacterium]